MILYKSIDTATRTESWRALQAGVDPINVRYVSPSFNNTSPNYSTIQAAIDDLTSGLVIVYPGEYSETVTMKHQIDVYGYPGAKLLLNASQRGFDFVSSGGDYTCGLYGYFDIDYGSKVPDNYAVRIVCGDQITVQMKDSINGYINIEWDSSVDSGFAANIEITAGEIGGLIHNNVNNDLTLINSLKVYADTIDVIELSNMRGVAFPAGDEKHDAIIDYVYGSELKLNNINMENARFKFIVKNPRITPTYDNNYGVYLDSCRYVHLRNMLIDVSISASALVLNRCNNFTARDCAFKTSSGLAVNISADTLNTMAKFINCVFISSAWSFENTGSALFNLSLFYCLYSADINNNNGLLSTQQQYSGLDATIEEM